MRHGHCEPATQKEKAVTPSYTPFQVGLGRVALCCVVHGTQVGNELSGIKGRVDSKRLGDDQQCLRKLRNGQLLA